MIQCYLALLDRNILQISKTRFNVYHITYANNISKYYICAITQLQMGNKFTYSLPDMYKCIHEMLKEHQHTVHCFYKDFDYIKMPMSPHIDAHWLNQLVTRLSVPPGPLI